MFDMKDKIFITIVTAIIVMTMGYIASATLTQPVGRPFMVESTGTEMLEMCPTEIPRTMPRAAMIAKDKNKVGAMIICEDFEDMNGNDSMAMFVEYTQIRVFCLPHPIVKNMFLYQAVIEAMWTCNAVTDG